MMEALEYLKAKARMCKKHRKCGVCFECPFGIKVGSSPILDCTRWEFGNTPEKAIEIVENWAKENPVKTYKDVLKERLPKAKIISSSRVSTSICKQTVFGGVCALFVGGKSCEDCWNQEYKEDTNDTNK